jgi:protein-tyrosine phosphatase
MTNTFEKINTADRPTSTPIKVCFVCTGNTCRSPMAMAVLNHLGEGRFVATSAGIMADKNAPINEKAKKALADAGILSTKTNDYENHKATQLNMGIMESCDKIVAVGQGHAMMIIQSFPLCASKVTSFDSPVTDPYGQPQEVYDKCLQDIIANVKQTFALGEE